MEKSHILIILFGAVMWSFVYFLSQGGLMIPVKTTRPPIMRPMLSVSNNSMKHEQTESEHLAGYFVSIEQKRRQKTLKKSCTRLKMNDVLPTNDEEFMKMIRNSMLYFSDKYKFVACMIPKVGCTNFKRIMLIEHGLSNVTDPKKIPGSVATETAKEHFRLDTLKNATEIRTRLKNYYKFVMVREPMHRVLSAFRNKFENLSNTYYRTLAKDIYEYSTGDKIKGNNFTISFKHFLRYITISLNEQDNHWKYYHELCSPCSIEYNFIAKIETVDDDMTYVMKDVGMASMAYPKRSLRPTDEEKVMKYYQTIPRNLSRAVHATYKDDFEIFGYSLPDMLQ